jgi:hypothetical protein
VKLRREALTRLLVTYLQDHQKDIHEQIVAFRKEHPHPPNIVVVPAMYSEVAWDARYLGLALVTPLFADDDPSQQPRVARTALPVERLRDVLLDTSPRNDPEAGT